MMVFVDAWEASVESCRLEVRRASSDDISDVILVLDEAAQWLASLGVEQWPSRFELDWVSPSIDDGCTWLVRLDDRLAATLVLDWSDPIWEAIGGSAGYIHRLAVRRHAAGLGSHLLAWAAGEVFARDRRLLRLDCVASNRRLRGYYEAAGFQHRGDVQVGGVPGQRFDAATRTLVSRYEAYAQDLQLGPR